MGGVNIHRYSRTINSYDRKSHCVRGGNGQQEIHNKWTEEFVNETNPFPCKFDNKILTTKYYAKSAAHRRQKTEILLYLN